MWKWTYVGENSTDDRPVVVPACRHLPARSGYHNRDFPCTCTVEPVRPLLKRIVQCFDSAFHTKARRSRSPLHQILADAVELLEKGREKGRYLKLISKSLDIGYCHRVLTGTDCAEGLPGCSHQLGCMRCSLCRALPLLEPAYKHHA